MYTKDKEFKNVKGLPFENEDVISIWSISVQGHPVYLHPYTRVQMRTINKFKSTDNGRLENRIQ